MRAVLVTGRSGPAWLRGPVGKLGLVLSLVTILLGSRVVRPATARADTWAPVAPLAVARANAQAVLLPNGTLLVAGGEARGANGAEYLAESEIYDPATNTWAVTGAMNTARSSFQATPLRDGRVFAAGGLGTNGYIASSEVYDPSTGHWASGPSMALARGDQAATLLPDGRVMECGGDTPDGATATCEVWDPASNQWNALSSMGAARADFSLVTLPNGEVLAAGGRDTSGVLNGAELYNPSTDQWSTAGILHDARSSYTATLLGNGQVLVAGGHGASGPLASAELYDPARNYWSTTGSMATAREDHTAVLLGDGTVLVAGGRSVVGGVITAVASTERYDPASGTWSDAGQMSAARFSHSAVVLPDGRALEIGGLSVGTAYLSSVDADTSHQIQPTATAAPSTATSTSTPTAAPVTDTATPTATVAPSPIAGTPTPTPVPPSVTPSPATATSTPMTTDFTILAVRVEHDGDQPDWSFSHAAVAKVAVGQRVALSIYVNFNALPNNAQVQTMLQVMLNGHSVRHSGIVSTMAHSDTGKLWQHSSYIPRSPGVYSVAATVTVNGETKRKSTSFRAYTPPAQPTALVFNSINVLDGRARSTASFRVGQRAYVVVRYQTANVPANATVVITDRLQYLSGRMWRNLGQPVQNLFDATDGPHIFEFSFVPQVAYKALRIVTTVSLASHAQTRSVTIHVHP